MNLSFSFIIPVFNRPNEIEELLSSMSLLQFDDSFEIVIVEDGSEQDAKAVVEKYKNILNISYYYKKNSGPGDSRNYGMQRAKGNYFLILDSDVILPSNYLAEVYAFLKNNYVHCFGGPDDAHDSFSDLQKAISYSMTSYLTTGGIRGRKNNLNKFQPRSFNMGLSKEAFLVSNGFGDIHPGEDPDLAIRLWKQGYQTALIPKAKVFHKRRISWRKFYQQVLKFGLVRPILNSWHPETAKITYWFPSMFMLALLSACVFALIGYWQFIVLFGLYFLVLFLGGTIKYGSIGIGVKVIIAVLVQFYGYGRGFLKSNYYIHLLKRNPKQQFPKLFFKK